MLRKDIDNTIDWTNPKNSIYSAFLSFMDNNGANALSWIQNTSQNTKLSLVLSMAIAKQLDEKNIFTNIYNRNSKKYNETYKYKCK